MSRFRSSLFLSFLTALILIVLSSGAFAEALRLAPLNPEFLKYREEAAKPALDTAAAAGHPLGYRPGPLDLSHIRAPAPDFFETAAAPPHRYDLREHLCTFRLRQRQTVLQKRTEQYHVGKAFQSLIRRQPSGV